MGVGTSEQAVAVTPHDSTNLAKPTRGLYVGVSGDVVAIIGGTAITFTAMAAGIIHPISVTRVNATNTTATNMVAIF
ncbi:MAG: spike base protein, RCAP_Rcc01079 family [Planctomycetota bacterium]|jgi:hypothetical protein